MSTLIVPVTDVPVLTLQCKHCRGVITSEETVAYHLVDQVLYGWCEHCFVGRQDAGLRNRQPATHYLKSGNNLYARGDWSGAWGDYSRAIEIDPGLAAAYANRGLVHLIQGKRADAEKDFVQCLKLDNRLRPALQKSITEIMQGRAAKRHN
jgi:tetratricopeptide (TPR) repeat protein